jgi:hypothetical protein
MPTTQVQTASTTAQAIINSASQDIRQQLAASGNDGQILLDYVNRTQLTLLRAVRWDFLLNTDIQYFITERQRTDYWIGPVGQGPTGAVDTKLNLTDFDIIQNGSVFDVSNQSQLGKTVQRPFSISLTTNDAQFRSGPPAEWRQDLSTPGLFQIYPAPDNNNTFTPVPESPYLITTVGGALAQRTYFVTVTFVDSLNNESTPCTREAIITIPANSLLTVVSPVLPFNLTTQGVSYNQYNVYASTTTGNETKQTVSTIALGTNWTEPTSGLTTNGGAAPITNKLTIMDGYLIVFRYFRQRQVVSDPSAVLQIPDVYKDIMVSGVNWLASRYLRLAQDAQMWQMEFMDGVRQMIRDRNLLPRENDFIQPDKTGVGIGASVPYQDFFDYVP